MGLSGGYEGVSFWKLPFKPRAERVQGRRGEMPIPGKGVWFHETELFKKWLQKKGYT